jgi:hypothetical protein
LFSDTWQRAQSHPVPHEEFFILLKNSDSWTTLVIEEIAREAAWTDFLTGPWGKDIIGRIKGLLEKFADKDSHPIAKTAAAVTVGFSSVIAIHFALPKDVTLPITAVVSTDSKEPLQVAFQATTDAHGNTLPVTFALTGTDEELPVNLKFSSDTKPVELRFVGDIGGVPSPSDALNHLAAELNRSNTTLSKAVTTLDHLAKTSSDLNGSELLQKLGGIDARVNNLSTTYAERASEELAAANRRAQILAGASFSPLQRIDATLRAHSFQTIVLPSFDSTSGQPVYKAVKLCVRDIESNGAKHQVVITPRKEDDGARCLPEDKRMVLDEGTTMSLGVVPWRITINSIERHWSGGNKAKVTLSAESSLNLASTAGLKTEGQP